MSLSLSDDLLELIIEELRLLSSSSSTQDLLSCCLAAKCLVRHSQKALFRSVRIPLVPTRAWKGSVQYTQYGTIVLDYGLYPKTLGFARAINSSPHLAQYVHQVAIEIPWSQIPPNFTKDGGLDDVARALTALNRVTDLTLCTILNEHPAICGMSASYEVSMPNQLKPVFGSMLRGQRLRYFSLKEIFQFPGYLLLGASQLEKIHLGRSGIARDDGRAVQKLQLEKPTIGYLRSLVCQDRVSQLDVDGLLEISAKLGPHGLQLRGIDTLEIEMCFRWPAPKYSILAAAERVTHLHLTMVTSTYTCEYEFATSPSLQYTPVVFSPIARSCNAPPWCSAPSLVAAMHLRGVQPPILSPRNSLERFFPLGSIEGTWYMV
ncbi:hypothetical protein FA13DRAFT_1861971 [Coprinellus micaceus]|uniref:F-box domain-containing protein n=1 Tax=Coprinellus micaceus TaxID=71717 RepID=A0A4Y7T605_COPMI|nr:hypothetical protein FA13DRAFT_1861971 [Coprinellus micaceus]